jgi:hypothetical protein
MQEPPTIFGYPVRLIMEVGNGQTLDYTSAIKVGHAPDYAMTVDPDECARVHDEWKRRTAPSERWARAPRETCRHEWQPRATLEGIEEHCAKCTAQRTVGTHADILADTLRHILTPNRPQGGG